MVKPESKRVIPIPAVYETVTESYEVEPATERVEVLQPKFETVTDKVLVTPATTKWVKKAADKNCLSADPNDCLVWCLVEVPAEYKTVTKQVNKGCDGSGVANSGCVKKTPIAAKMGTRTVQKLKSPAATKEEIIPGEYATVTKQVVKTPASTREEIIPAEYKTVTKQVLKTPASTREEIIPAEYSTVTKQVVKTPASTREEIIPAEYKTVTKQVVKTPASYKEEDVPAQYATVTKKAVSAPTTTREVQIPAEYATVTKRRLVKAGGFSEWREVLCQDKVTGSTVRKIQRALKERGYEPGPEDDIMGPLTKAALTKFQQDKGLPVGNLNIETLKALGVQ
jgi:hypothetical protein